MDSFIPNINIDNEIFALDSTTISCSINLLTWAEGKYSKGTVKVHTLIDLRGSIPTFILITDGKYHTTYRISSQFKTKCQRAIGFI